MGARPLALVVSLAAPPAGPAGAVGARAWPTASTTSARRAGCDRGRRRRLAGRPGRVTGTALGVLEGPAVLRSGARAGRRRRARRVDRALGGRPRPAPAAGTRWRGGPGRRRRGAGAGRTVAPRPPYPAGPLAAAGRGDRPDRHERRPAARRRPPRCGLGRAARPRPRSARAGRRPAGGRAGRWVARGDGSRPGCSPAARTTPCSPASRPTSRCRRRSRRPGAAGASAASWSRPAPGGPRRLAPLHAVTPAGAITGVPAATRGSGRAGAGCG